MWRFICMLVYGDEKIRKKKKKETNHSVGGVGVFGSKFSCAL